MEAFFLIAVAFGFALLYGLIALVRTIRRVPEIGRLDIFLAFLVALLPLTALTISAVGGTPDNRVSAAALLLAAGLLVTGVIFTLLEVFRPQRLKQSRGILTLGVAVLVAGAAVAVPIAWALISLPPTTQTNTQTAANTASSLQPTEDPAAEFFAVFNQVIQVVADEADLTFDDVLTQLDEGKTVAQMVSDAGGDLEKVIDDITGIMQDFLRELVAEDRVDRVQASLGIAGMEVVVRYAVQNDLRSLQRAGRREAGVTEEPTPGEGTPTRSFFAFLTATFTPDEPINTIQPSLTATITPLPTITPQPTAEPSATRTPRPTATITPSRTRFAYVTRTPTLTPTLPSPCVIIMNFNVNLRQAPDTEAALVTTIPFETAVNGFGRNDDSTWWFVEYNGSAGWVKAEFVTAVASCSFLPVREP